MLNGVALEDDKREEFNKIEQVSSTKYVIVNELGCVYYAIVYPHGIPSVHRCLCAQCYALQHIHF